MKLTHKVTGRIAALLLCMLISTDLAAQEVAADSYFHTGAQEFINNNIPGALEAVNQGIAAYPEDPKLNALLEKIKEEQEKQQQQQQNQDQDQNQQDDQQEQNQQNQDQQNKNEQEEQQQNQDQNQQEQNPENQNQEQQQQMMPKEISKEEADKILQALAQKEKELLKEFKKQKPQGSSTHEKDW